MIKRLFSLTMLIAASATISMAQTSIVNATQTENSVKEVVPYGEKEEAAARGRIEGLEAKLLANKDNEKVDFAKEMKKLEELKVYFNDRAKDKFKMEK
jgi:hypothetical protein